MDNSTDFSINEADFAFSIARIPHEFEKMDSRPDNLDSIVERVAPAEVRNNVQLIQVSNTTCVIAYNPQDHSTTISFDPTHTFGDKMDNLNRKHREHSLGGEVHAGNYGDLVRDQETGSIPGGDMVDAISGVLHDYSGRNETPLTVNFSGFSKGGGQAAMAAGELMARDLFSDPNIQLGSIYTFGTLAVGDHEFVTTFNQNVEELGGKAFTVELQGDRNPTVLTEDGPGYFTRYDYEQVGTPVLIQTHPSPSLTIAPDEAAIDAFRALPSPDGNTHNMDRYAAAISAIELVEQGSMAPVEDLSISPAAIPTQPRQ